MEIRLFLVEDHPVVLAGVRAFVDDSEFVIVGEALNAIEAVERAPRAEPQLLLMDVRLPGPDGLECLGRLRKAGVSAPALVYSGYENPTYVARAMALGASGFLLKSVSRGELLSAMRTTAAGQTCWSRDEVRRLTGALAAPRVEDDIEAPLTRRENEVLKQLAFGLTNKEIAQALGISYETVKEHVQHILRKVGANDRTQAAVWAVRRGLV
ncbi:MAG: response regulator transcription factor [Planctomycetota bacterium]